MLPLLGGQTGEPSAPAPPASETTDAEAAPAAPAPADPAPAAPAPADTTKTEPPAPAPEAPAGELVRVLILDLQAPAEDEKAAELLSSLLAEAMSQAEGVEVNTSADLRRLMELEADKVAIGCSDENCLAEIAGAFGVPYIVFGKLTKLGPTATLSLSLFDAEAARPIWRRNLRAPDEIELQYQMADGAKALLAVLAERQPSIVVGEITGPERFDTGGQAEEPESSGVPWLLISGGVVAGVGVASAIGLASTALVLGEVVVPTFKDGTIRTFAFYGGWAALAGVVVAVGIMAVGGGLALVSVFVE